MPPVLLLDLCWGLPLVTLVVIAGYWLLPVSAYKLPPELKPEDENRKTLEGLFRRVAAEQRFKDVCQRYVWNALPHPERAEAEALFSSNLKTRTRFGISPDTQLGLAEYDHGATEEAELFVLALSLKVASGWMGNLAAAHELFHLARHHARLARFPTTQHGRLTILNEEVIVWGLTARYAPVAFVMFAVPWVVALAALTAAVVFLASR